MRDLALKVMDAIEEIGTRVGKDRFITPYDKDQFINELRGLNCMVRNELLDYDDNNLPRGDESV